MADVVKYEECHTLQHEERRTGERGANRFDVKKRSGFFERKSGDLVGGQAVILSHRAK
jgi:hypothetical protein